MVHRRNCLINNKSNDLYAVDVFKFICSILVVIIHVSPFKNSPWQIGFIFENVIARLAVPFFFVCNGYFVFRKIDYNNIDFNKIKYTILKMIRLYFLWSIIYIPYFIDKYINSQNNEVNKFLKFFIDFLILGTTSHLWYLFAVCISFGIIYIFLRKKITIKYIFIFSLIFYMLGLVIDAYYEIPNIFSSSQIDFDLFIILNNNFPFSRNGLFFALVFVCIGILLAWYPIKLSTQKSLIFLIGSLFLYSLEIVLMIYFNISSKYEKYIFMPLVLYFLCNFLFNIKLKYSFKYKMLRDISIWVYFIHVGVNWITDYFISYNSFPVLKFVVVLFVSIIFSYLVLKISKNDKFKWMKKLF